MLSGVGQGGRKEDAGVTGTKEDIGGRRWGES